jgi:hypothetical protein
MKRFWVIAMPLVLLAGSLFLYQNCSDAEFGALNSTGEQAFGVVDDDNNDNEDFIVPEPTNPGDEGPGGPGGPGIGGPGEPGGEPGDDDDGYNPPPQVAECRMVRKLGVWHDPENKRKAWKARYLGDIEPYSGALSAVDNYDYRSVSVHPQVGPTPKQGVFNAAFYEGADGLSLMFYSNADNAPDNGWRELQFDLSVRGNRQRDNVLLSDDKDELALVDNGRSYQFYEARFRYKNNSDGGVVGPLLGKRFRAHFNMLDTSDIQEIYVASGDGSGYSIPMDQASHFFMGHHRSVRCPLADNKIIFHRYPNKRSRRTSGFFLFDLKRPLKNGEYLKCYIDDTEISDCRERRRVLYEGLTYGNHSFTVLLYADDGLVHKVVYNWTIVERNLARRCLNLNRRQTKMVDVVFPARTQTCDWGNGESLPKRNAFAQAIERQQVSLQVPEGGKICDIEVMTASGEPQSFKYDDLFFLSMNDVVLASNARFILSEGEEGLMGLDWLNSRGEAFPNNFNNRTDQNYCLGESMGKSVCEWPMTQKTGPIKLQFDPELIEKIEQNTNALELSIVGDDDGSDCKHTGLNLKVRVDYVE